MRAAYAFVASRLLAWLSEDRSDIRIQAVALQQILMKLRGYEGLAIEG
jgi:hypothetical protein